MRSVRATLVIAGLLVAAAGFTLLGYQSGVVSTVSAQAPPQGCSVATLRGNYGDWFQFLDNRSLGGQPLAGGYTPGAGVGVVTYDGRGNYEQVETINYGTAVFPGLQVTGTYTVNSNCTGTRILNFQGGGTNVIEFVIVDNGKEVHELSVDPAGVAVGTLKKQ